MVIQSLLLLSLSPLSLWSLLVLSLLSPLMKISRENADDQSYMALISNGNCNRYSKSMCLEDPSLSIGTDADSTTYTAYASESKKTRIKLQKDEKVSSGVELTTLVMIGTDCIGSCKSNYHTIKTSPVHFKIIGIIYHKYCDIIFSLTKFDFVTDLFIFL
jgi:hypothetical protein